MGTDPRVDLPAGRRSRTLPARTRHRRGRRLRPRLGAPRRRVQRRPRARPRGAGRALRVRELHGGRTARRRARRGVAAAGLAWDDLALCAISHVHLDHTGGLRLVPPGTPVALQRREWDWLQSGIGRRETVVVDDVLDADVRVFLLDGDTELAPGLTALDTRGHTPGHQSFRVDLPDRTVVLACDAADLERNLTERTPCGWVGRAGDELEAQRSIDRLADLAAEPGVEVWPGHDPEWAAWRR
ncbi:MBL fold metallo-hydrolase [Curtobacterium sp. 24E2]|nr:MBL fold metallo-hydrolase [Curtobacterium sp. 24E2]